MSAQAQESFDFIDDDQDEAGDGVPMPTEAEGEEMGLDEAIIVESPAALAGRLRKQGMRRRDILEQTREIAGLLRGEGRSSVPGTAPLVDAFEHARMVQRRTPESWDPQDWSNYLEVLEEEDDERRKREYPNNEAAPL